MAAAEGAAEGGEAGEEGEPGGGEEGGIDEHAGPVGGDREAQLAGNADRERCLPHTAVERGGCAGGCDGLEGWDRPAVGANANEVGNGAPGECCPGGLIP